MLRLEWTTRLFSVIMTILLGIFLSSPDINLFFGLFFWVSLAYGVLLLFKKYAYPWPLGSYYNLIIEAIELMELLYIHSVSSSPLVVILFISFIVRMVLIYDNRIFVPAGILAAAFFILVDFYTVGPSTNIKAMYRPIYWGIGFGFLIWVLWEFRSFVKSLEKNQQSLKDALGIKEILIDELNQSRDQLLESNDQLYIWANTDPLTNLFNSRYFNRYWDNLSEQFSQIKQDNYPIALVVVDVQGHKIYNDVYGHAAGDILIQDLAAILRECAEAEDILVRYSDYVFAVIIPGQQEGEAIKFYHRLKQGVEKYGKEHPGMRNIEISVGWSSCSDVAYETREELMARAINSMRIIG